MVWRVVQSPKKPIGLLIGWLIPNRPDLDRKLREALPGWAIVVTDQAPLSVTSGDIQAARRAVKAPVSLPVAGFAWSAGVQSLRAAIIANAVEFWGVAVFDGTHANTPPAEWQIAVWAHLAQRAQAGLGPFVATCTGMTYTKDIPAGTKGRAWPTGWVLARALGRADGGLLPGLPVDDGGLYVAAYASDAGPTAEAKHAHEAQILDIAPGLLGRFFGPGPSPEPGDQPIFQEPATPWRDPSLSLGARLVLWARAEYQTWKDTPLGENLGPNDSPRIREYLSLPYKRRLTGQALKLRAVPWCAVAACYGFTACCLPSDSPPMIRVSGLELEQDAKANHVWTQDPSPGALVIMSRPGPTWGRHVGIVVSVNDGTITIAAGNEGDTWAERDIKLGDPIILGYIPIG
jgi:hypothetical protein